MLLMKYTCYIEFSSKCLTHDIEYIVMYFGVAVWRKLYLEKLE